MSSIGGDAARRLRDDLGGGVSSVAVSTECGRFVVFLVFLVGGGVVEGGDTEGGDVVVWTSGPLLPPPRCLNTNVLFRRTIFSMVR